MTSFEMKTKQNEKKTPRQREKSDRTDETNDKQHKTIKLVTTKVYAAPTTTATAIAKLASHAFQQPITVVVLKRKIFQSVKANQSKEANREMKSPAMSDKQQKSSL